MNTDNERRLEQQLAHATAQLSRGQVPQAIETLRELLGEDPENGQAHAVLACCLVQSKRLAAAEVEARLALECDPEDASALVAMAAVDVARRRFEEAEEALKRALELDPTNASTHCELVRLYGLWGKYERAAPMLARALQLDSDDPSVLAAAAEHEFQRGDLEKSRNYAKAALEEDPACCDALVTMGRLELFDGNEASAREHAVFALRQNSSGERALHLFASIKARQSLMLGLWWRWNVWLHSQGSRNSIRILLVTFVGYRLASILLRHLRYEAAASAIEYLWLMFCVYTWVGPMLFQRMVAKELESVELDSDF